MIWEYSDEHCPGRESGWLFVGLFLTFGSWAIKDVNLRLLVPQGRNREKDQDEKWGKSRIVFWVSGSFSPLHSLVTWANKLPLFLFFIFLPLFLKLDCSPVSVSSLPRGSSGALPWVCRPHFPHTVFYLLATVSCHPPLLLFASRLFLFWIFSECCFLSGYTFIKGLIQENNC